MENATVGYAGFIDTVRRRRSVRWVEPAQAVDRSGLLQVAEAARWAPMGANSQSLKHARSYEGGTARQTREEREPWLRNLYSIVAQY